MEMINKLSMVQVEYLNAIACNMVLWIEPKADHYFVVALPGTAQLLH